MTRRASTTVFRWADVARHLASEPAGTRFRVARHLAEHPRDGGLRVTMDVPVGQRADFCKQRLRVQDFGTHYEARLDPAALVGSTALAASAAAAPAPTAPAPTNQLMASAALGSAVGLLLGRTREATLVGALLAAALTAAGRARTRR